MKKVGLVGSALLVALWMAPGRGETAECRSDQKLGLIGASSSAGTAVLTGSAAEVRLISVTCTTSGACNAGLYNGTVVGDAVDANFRIEPSAASGTSVFVPSNGFFDVPLTFESGIVFVNSGNVQFISVFGCQQR